MFTNMFSKSFKSLFFLLLFVGFSSFAQAQALNLAGCQTFSNTLGTNYMVTWGSANAAQRAQWQTSGCYTSPQAAAPVAPAPVVAAAVPFMGCQVMSNTLGTNHVTQSWGNANAAQQAQWMANGCNTSPPARVVGILSYQCCTKITEAQNWALMEQCYKTGAADTISKNAKPQGAIVLVAGGVFIKPGGSNITAAEAAQYAINARCNQEYERRK